MASSTTTTITTTTQPKVTAQLLPVNTIALIAGISVIGTILLIVLLIAIIVWCRKLAKRRRRDRSRQYMVQDGASPFSSLHGPSSGGIPSHNATGYENKAVDVGEFRPNPLAENPFHHQPSLLNLPPNLSEYNVDQQRYDSPRFAQSTQSVNFDNRSFYASLYDKLVDTVHIHQGRPLYLCKREHYHDVSDYFDIIGKTRTNDWIIKPRKNTPKRPPQSKSKKQKAPKPGNAQNQQKYEYYENPKRSNGYPPRPGAKITTPFGAAERMPSGYIGGMSNSNNAYEGYASLPRDSNLRNGRNYDGNKLRRQVSSSAADRPSHSLNEQQYAEVMRKNALNGMSTNSTERKYRSWDPNPSRRRISTIEESPQIQSKPLSKGGDTTDGTARERSGSVSTVKSMGKKIADQFQFLDQYETEEERF